MFLPHIDAPQLQISNAIKSGTARVEGDVPCGKLRFCRINNRALFAELC